MVFSCRIEHLIQVDASIIAFEIRVHEGFDLMVAGVNPSCLPVAHRTSPTRGVIGIYLPPVSVWFVVKMLE